MTKPVHPDKFRFPVSDEVYQKQLKAYEAYEAHQSHQTQQEARQRPNVHTQYQSIPSITFPRDSVARKLVQQLEDGING